MEKIKIIHNPSSGRQMVEKKIDRICKILIDNGYIIGKFQTEKKNDAMLETIKCCKEDWDAIIVCGGDGTVNEVATGIVRGGRKIPVAILGAGTVNDFANFMELPKNPDEFCNMIINGKSIDVDLGKCGKNYFVNVAAGGLLTNVAHQVSSELKTILGRTAYYIEGIKEIPKHKFNSFDINIKSSEFTEDLEALLFLVCNSSSIGGFKKLAPEAEVKDGYLDCIVIKKAEFQNIITIFIKLLKGELTSHPNVLHFKTKKVTINSHKKVHIDLDGEFGGVLPASFEVVEQSFRIFVK
ncbi:diacylglycerol/lipid kinase family protein [Caldisalinibacter kiritimatiensis]|uniref:Transcription regulator n=1 Tax=Caldisalinibacter kiritimatiensis TaxID=1304284 RepID=R1AWT5_9FIRM|nr:YegS/Rv2252/BmrU family lipid kinase [Caldisalinibacter kiritimatiensis]EOD01658.1 Transcription regulator [Caldisalinibacter kiritimatiensis]